MNFDREMKLHRREMLHVRQMLRDIYTKGKYKIEGSAEDLQVSTEREWAMLLGYFVEIKPCTNEGCKYHILTVEEY